MEFYIPSVFILIIGMAVAFVFIPRLSNFILVIVAGLCLVLAMYAHSSLFFNEYQNMNWLNTAGVAGPHLLISLVFFLSFGYVLLLITSGKAPTLSVPSFTIPPPETATNIETRGIGNGLVSSGVVNASKNAEYNSINAGQNAINSALSKRI